LSVIIWCQIFCGYSC